MIRRAAYVSLVLMLGLGCGPRTLELSLSIDPGCTVQIPAGGSLAYELVSGGQDGGPAPTLCGGCLTVTTAISDVASLIARLKEAAPTCTVTPGTTLLARVTGYTGGVCSSGGASPAICAASTAILVGDGRSDGNLALTLRCDAQCVPNGCVSVSCMAQGKNCDQVPDGCGNTLDCGVCKPPERCGGAGIANVCGR